MKSPARPLRVLVTRPTHDAAPWVAALREQGFDAEAVPLIAIAPLAEAGRQQALALAWQALPSYQACLFVSRNAVEHFFKQKRPLAQSNTAGSAIKKEADQLLTLAAGADVSPHLSLDAVPAQLRFMAPGPGTAQALQDCGVPLAQIDSPALDAAQFDSENLWQQVGGRNWRGSRVLVVNGLGPSDSLDAQPGATAPGLRPASPGRDWITRQLQSAGASVDTLSVYQRRMPLLDAQRIHALASLAADGRAVWIFSSSEAVGHLLQLLRQKQTQTPHAKACLACDLEAGLEASPNKNPKLTFAEARATAIATHPRIALTLRQARWRRVLDARPALADVVASLNGLNALGDDHPLPSAS